MSHIQEQTQDLDIQNGTVFAKATISRGTKFGPFEGKFTSDPIDRRFAWEVSHLLIYFTFSQCHRYSVCWWLIWVHLTPLFPSSLKEYSHYTIQHIHHNCMTIQIICFKLLLSSSWKKIYRKKIERVTAIIMKIWFQFVKIIDQSLGSIQMQPPWREVTIICVINWIFHFGKLVIFFCCFSGWGWIQVWQFFDGFPVGWF